MSRCRWNHACQVGDYMDRDALTTCMGADLLSVAQMFSELALSAFSNFGE